MLGREAMRMSAKDRRQVESKSVDAQLARPVAQAVEHQGLDLRVIGIERITGASVIDVGGRVVRFEAVVGLVVQAAEAERRAGAVALAGMVERDIEDHLHAGIVNGIDHVDEFMPRIAGREPRHRREERDRVVAPVVAQAALREMMLIDVGLDRHQLDGGYAQRLKVVEH